MVEIEFWFEFASTYSYPAAMRIEALARAAERRVCWRPFLLGPIFQAQGWNDSPFNFQPAKGRYMWRDLERICARLGLPFRRPSVFPRNGLLAARLAVGCAGEDWLPEFVRRVYSANLGEDRDISQAEVLGAILESLAQPRSLLDRAHASRAKDELRAQTERAAARGIFGAPTFVVNGELFWGNDRLEEALAWRG